MDEFQIGTMFADIATLKEDVKEVKSDVKNLNIWKWKTIGATSIISSLFATLATFGISFLTK